MKIPISFLIEKNSDLHLMKMQISFYFDKNSDLHLMKMQISFLIEKKNSNLHLMKMQIIFFFFLIYKQIFGGKKKDLDNKNIKNIFK